MSDFKIPDADLGEDRRAVYMKPNFISFKGC